MAHLWRVIVETSLDQATMLKSLSSALADFSWRMGDSDTAGPYIDGRGPADEEIELWIEDGSVDVSLSTRLATYDAKDAGSLESDLIRRVLGEVLPRIGRVTSVREH